MEFDDALAMLIGGITGSTIGYQAAKACGAGLKKRIYAMVIGNGVGVMAGSTYPLWKDSITGPRYKPAMYPMYKKVEAKI